MKGEASRGRYARSFPRLFARFPCVRTKLAFQGVIRVRDCPSVAFSCLTCRFCLFVCYVYGPRPYIDRRWPGSPFLAVFQRVTGNLFRPGVCLLHEVLIALGPAVHHGWYRACLWFPRFVRCPLVVVRTFLVVFKGNVAWDRTQRVICLFCRAGRRECAALVGWLLLFAGYIW